MSRIDSKAIISHILLPLKWLGCLLAFFPAIWLYCVHTLSWIIYHTLYSACLRMYRKDILPTLGRTLDQRSGGSDGE